MKKIILLSWFVILSFLPHQSKASFLIDPYIGYNLAWDTATESNVDIDVTRNGVAYGARAGYQFLGFMAGLEYGMASGMTSDVAAAAAVGISAAERSYDSSRMGVFVGYELPIMLRAWATYFFDVNWEPETGSKQELTSVAFGVGFTGLPFVSLNAEYRMNTFDSNQSGFDAYKSNGELFLSLSLPLNL